MENTLLLLGSTAFSILLLLVLILWLRLHAFIALLVISIFLGVTLGLPYNEIVGAIQQGMGGTLGFVATVVGIGAIFGQVLESSGGTEAIARSLIRYFGEKKAHWSLMIAGFMIAIPIFFDVGFILLIPIVQVLARETKKSVVLYAIPLLAGLAVTHSFVPPTPGPVAVADMIGAELGWVILMGFIVGIPTAIIAGPIYGQWISRYIHPTLPIVADQAENEDNTSLPSFWLVSSIILVPLVLMISGSLVEFASKQGYISNPPLVSLISFLGHPFVALLISTFIGLYILGIRRGFSAKILQELSNKALAPAGMIVLITGAGGVFKQMLIVSGVGTALASSMSDLGIPVLLLAFVIAALVRVSLGSASVSMITAAGIIGPVLEMISIDAPHRALVVIAIASGATVLSHVNDSGFWLVGKYLGLTESQTLKTWTVMETIIGVVGFLITALLYVLI
ncbi:MAG: gluconate:H+ symporter [Bacteroidales bacterium]